LTASISVFFFRVYTGQPEPCSVVPRASELLILLTEFFSDFFSFMDSFAIPAGTAGITLSCAGFSDDWLFCAKEKGSPARNNPKIK